MGELSVKRKLGDGDLSPLKLLAQLDAIEASAREHLGEQLVARAERRDALPRGLSGTSLTDHAAPLTPNNGGLARLLPLSLLAPPL